MWQLPCRCGLHGIFIIKLMNMLSDNDLKHLKHCLRLAEASLEAGDKPFGSIWVNVNNEVLAEARNRVNEKTELAHPEYELAAWAAENLSVEERAETTMYTTGEHCPMCAAAHGWAGLGLIVYLGSAKQLGEWLEEIDVVNDRVFFHPVQKIIPNIEVRGPATGELLEQIKKLHHAYYLK